MELLKATWPAVFDSLRDLLPIILIIGFFQFAVLQQPIPNLGEIASGKKFLRTWIRGTVYLINSASFAADPSSKS